MALTVTIDAGLVGYAGPIASDVPVNINNRQTVAVSYAADCVYSFSLTIPQGTGTVYEFSDQTGGDFTAATEITFGVWEAITGAQLLIKTLTAGDIELIDTDTITAAITQAEAKLLSPRRPETGIRQLLDNSDDFGAGWSKSTGVTVEYGFEDPDGGMTASKVTFPGADEALRFYLTLDAGDYIGDVWIKGVSGETIRAKTDSVNSTNETLSGAWQFLSSASTGITPVDFSLNTWVGATAREIYVWHPQFTAGTTSTAYQSRVDEYDVVEAGVADAVLPDLHAEVWVDCSGDVAPIGIGPASPVSAASATSAIDMCIPQGADRAFIFADADGDLSEVTEIAFSVWEEERGALLFTRTLSDGSITQANDTSFIADVTSAQSSALTDGEKYAEVWTNTATDDRLAGRGVFEVIDTRNLD